MTGEFSYPLPGRKIVVVGVTGSGKTTFAGRLAAKLNLAHVELDSLHWEPNWQSAALEVFRQRVTDALACPGWVVDGNYSKTRDLVWSAADTLVWLDYPLWLTLYRLSKRSFRRYVTREKLWNDNVEDLRQLFFSKDALFGWAFKSYRKITTTYVHLLTEPQYSHLQVIRFKWPRQAETWLQICSKNLVK